MFRQEKIELVGQNDLAPLRVDISRMADGEVLYFGKFDPHIKHPGFREVYGTKQLVNEHGDLVNFMIHYISGSSISWSHAALECKGAGRERSYVLHDLGSWAGTAVKGEKLGYDLEAELKDAFEHWMKTGENPEKCIDTRIRMANEGCRYLASGDVIGFGCIKYGDEKRVLFSGGPKKANGIERTLPMGKWGGVDALKVMGINDPAIVSLRCLPKYYNVALNRIRSRGLQKDAASLLIQELNEAKGMVADYLDARELAPLFENKA